MRKTNKRSLKHFEDVALTKKEAHQVDGSLSYDEQLRMITDELNNALEASGSCRNSWRIAYSTYIKKYTKLFCYGNINGLYS